MAFRFIVTVFIEGSFGAMIDAENEEDAKSKAVELMRGRFSAIEKSIAPCFDSMENLNAEAIAVVDECSSGGLPVSEGQGLNHE